MINITINKTNGLASGFVVAGHSCYAKNGNDIVCSAISALAQTLLLTLKEIYDYKCSYSVRNGYLKVRVLDVESLGEVQILFRAFKLGVDAIAEQYSRYVIVNIVDHRGDIMKCEHKWVDMEDGNLDRFCVKCGKKAKQGVLRAQTKASMKEPILQNMTSGINIGNIKLNEEETLKFLEKELKLIR